MFLSSWPCSLQLGKVLHVPSLSVNLLSLQKICKHNRCRIIVVEFEFCLQKMESNKVLYQNKATRTRLFKVSNLQVKSSSSQTHSSAVLSHSAHSQDQSSCAWLNKVNTSLWYQRLGYPTNQISSKMLKSSLIKRVDDNSDTLCSSGIYRKMSSFCFLEKVRKSLVPFHKIHSHVWGPSAYLSFQGHKY